MRKSIEVADGSSRGPNIIHIQGECAGTMADKASKGVRRELKACRKTEEFGVYSVR